MTKRALQQIKDLNIYQCYNISATTMAQKQIFGTQKELIYLKNLVKSYDKPNWNEICQNIRHKFNYEKLSARDCHRQYQLLNKKDKPKWGQDEIKVLFQHHLIFGKKWKQISEQLNGKSDNETKNMFYSIMRKRLRKLHKLLFCTKDSTQLIKHIRPNTIQKIIHEKTVQGSQVPGIDQFVKLLVSYDDVKSLQIPLEYEEHFRFIMNLILQNTFENSQKKKALTPNLHHDNLSEQIKEFPLNMSSGSSECFEDYDILNIELSESQKSSQRSLNQSGQIKGGSIRGRILLQKGQIQNQEQYNRSIYEKQTNKSDFFQDPHLNTDDFRCVKDPLIKPFFGKIEEEQI